MKKFAFFIALAGFIVLGFTMMFDEPVHLSSLKQLYSLEKNTFVETSGTIESVRSYYGSYICKLDNEIEFISDSYLSLGEYVYVRGIIESYNNNTRIKPIQVLRNVN